MVRNGCREQLWPALVEAAAKAQSDGLLEVVAVWSHLTKRVAGGEGVSYGHAWVAERPSNLALVPVGYADGVPRALSGQMSVWLRGRRLAVTMLNWKVAGPAYAAAMVETAGRLAEELHGPGLPLSCGAHMPELAALIM